MFGDLSSAADLIIRNARKYPKKMAVISNTRRLTWKELNDRTNSLANALLALGVQNGDRIAVLTLNCHQCYEITFAGAKIGAPLVRLNYRLVTRELEYIINDSGANTLILGENYLHHLDHFLSHCKSLKNIICIGEAPKGVMSYEGLIERYPSSEPQPIRPIREDDLLSIVYTSGTTGFPKGAMWTHKSTVFNLINMGYYVGIKPDTNILLIFPAFFSGGTMLIYLSTYIGATVVIMDWDTEKVLDVMEKERINFVALAPSMLIFMLDSAGVDRRDFKDLKLILYAGAPMPIQPLKKAMELFRCDFIQFYGPTECGPSGTCLLPEDHVLWGTEKQLERLKSAGREMINVRVRVVDEEGRDVPAGEKGEVIIKSPGNMLGYWNQPEETQKTIRDGFVYTGDIATIDEDNYIYIVDRKKDMIISGGANIYPAEVEKVLYSHPAILEAAVIGVPDEKWGESVKAIVVLKSGMKLTEEEIIEFCKQNLASYKKPKSVDFVDSLPKSPSGKILKTELREKYWEEKDRRV